MSSVVMSYLNLSCWENLYSHKLRSRSEISKAARRFAKLNLPKAQQPLDRTNSFFDHDFACDSSFLTSGMDGTSSGNQCPT